MGCAVVDNTLQWKTVKEDALLASGGNARLKVIQQKLVVENISAFSFDGESYAVKVIQYKVRKVESVVGIFRN